MSLCETNSTVVALGFGVVLDGVTNVVLDVSIDDIKINLSHSFN